MASAVSDTPKTLIDSLDQCLDWAVSGCRPRDQFKIGTEYERFAFGPDGKTLPYAGPVGIGALLQGFVDRHGWAPIVENGNSIALTRSGASISLEPAGQFELSGAVQPTIAGTIAELNEHQQEFSDVAGSLGVRLAWLGLNPFDSIDAAPKMPKGRYKIMRDWMPRVGGHGLHMMHLTCTVQANLDFSSESECMEMMRAAHLLSPVLIALFANSPWLHGKPSGFKAYRASLWTDVDPARCNVGSIAFDRGATMADYVQWALDVPLYFLDVENADGSHGYGAMDGVATFRDFFERGIDGRRPTLADWEMHVSTVFPDVRLKRWLEIRQCDLVPARAIPSMPALCKGLLYHVDSRRQLLQVLGDGDPTLDRAALRLAACRDGLAARVGSIAVNEWAQQTLKLAAAGLHALALETGVDGQAEQALQPLQEIVFDGRPPFWQRAAAVLEAGGGFSQLADLE